MDIIDRVWSLLLDHVGKHHAIGGAALASAAELKDQRELRLVIHRARVEHKLPILSAPGLGYWRPANLDEIDDFYWAMREHAMEELLVASTVRKLGSARIQTPAGDDWIDRFLREHYSGKQAALFR